MFVARMLFFIALLFSISCQHKKNNVPYSQISDNSSNTIHKYYDSSKTFSKNTFLKLNYINRAYNLSVKAKNDTLLLKVLIYKTQLLNQNNELDSALFYSYKMLRLSKKLRDTFSIGKSYYKLGLYHNNQRAIDSSYFYYYLSKDIFIGLNDSTRIGKSLLNMAIIQSDYGDYIGSDETAVKALKYFKLPKHSKHIASTYNCLAISTKKQKDYQESLYWYDLAINTAKNRINKLRYLNNIANVYTQQKNYDKALVLFDSILKDPILEKNKKTKARIIDNKAYTVWLKTNTTKVEKDFIEALKIRTKEKDLYGLMASNSHLSEYYENKNIKKAIQYAERMYVLSTQLHSVDDRLEALKKLVKLEKNLLRSNTYSKVYIRLTDSIINVRERYKNQFAKIRYDSEKNRVENLNLKAETALKQVELEKVKRHEMILWFLGLLFIMTALFLYFQIKTRHKKEKLKQVYTTETRISKKVHDEVANDIYHAMTKLQHGASVKEDILDDLERVYIKTRDISKENSTINFKEDFASILNDLLLSYKDDSVNVITRNLTKINWNNISELKKTAIYRVLQELMTNMKKYSKANIAVLAFSKEKNNIIINYKDDGVGCDLKKKSGLQNAETRIQSVNGTIIFESENNNGFKATIKI